MNLLKNQKLLVLLRIFLGAMFIYASVPKIIDPFAFAVDVYNYKLLSGFAVGLVAAGLPWLESVAGTFLVLGIRVRACALVITGMLAAFTLAIFINTLRGIDVDCGCFATERSIGWMTVAEDSLFTLLGLWYVLCADNFFELENMLRKRTTSRGSYRDAC